MSFPGTLKSGNVTYTTESMIEPCSEMAGDGAVWWGLAMNHGKTLYYTVWKEQKGVFTLVWKSRPGDHRGTMRAHANGQLWVTLFVGAGDGAVINRGLIGGFAPLKG